MSATRTQRTLAVAAEVAELITLDGARVAVIGAVALAVHGHARATLDLDLATELDPATQLTSLHATLLARGYQAVLRLPDSTDPLGGVITVSGDDFDDVQVINFYNPAQQWPTPATQALDDAVDLPGTGLRVVTVVDLILLKLYAGGLKSLVDILELLAANPDVNLDELLPRCEKLGLEAQLDRLRSELAGGG